MNAIDLSVQDTILIENKDSFVSRKELSSQIIFAASFTKYLGGHIQERLDSIILIYDKMFRNNSNFFCGKVQNNTKLDRKNTKRTFFFAQWSGYCLMQSWLCYA